MGSRRWVASVVMDHECPWTVGTLRHFPADKKKTKASALGLRKKERGELEKATRAEIRALSNVFIVNLAYLRDC